MVDVLLLNASMEPIGIKSLQRAIGLIMAGKVDVVETVPDKVLRSPSMSMPFPSVLRLRYYVNVPKRGSVWSRRGVLQRDNYTCQYCGKAMRHEDATVDHIVPQQACRRENIRANSWANTCASCGKCNTRKSNRSMRDAGMRFFDQNFEPKSPRANYLIVRTALRPEWAAYIGG